MDASYSQTRDSLKINMAKL